MMPAGRLLACEHNGPLGKLTPEGRLRFGRAQLLNDKYRNLPTSPSFFSALFECHQHRSLPQAPRIGTT